VYEVGISYPSSNDLLPRRSLRVIDCLPIRRLRVIDRLPIRRLRIVDYTPYIHNANPPESDNAGWDDIDRTDERRRADLACGLHAGNRDIYLWDNYNRTRRACSGDP
jgi:hypothetical protein